MPRPAALRALEPVHHHPGEDKETCDLGTRGNKSRTRRRRPLIGIRRPEMKRHRCHLEAKADDRHHERPHQQRVKLRAGDGKGDLAQVGRAR
jgi:hypothetical protein